MDNLDNPAGGVSHTHMLAKPNTSELCVAPVVSMRRSAGVTPQHANEADLDLVQLLQSTIGASSSTRGVLADLNGVIRKLQQQLNDRPGDFLLAEAIRRLCSARGSLEAAERRHAAQQHA